MSVDERRETFHVNRIAPSDLDERLLAQAYRPDVVAAVRTLISKGARPLSSALDGPLTQGRTPEYGDDGDLCLKTRNVVGGVVDGSSVDRVSGQFARANGASRISNETVLMNRSGAGSIGRVSIYFGAGGVFTNEELFRFRIAAPHDPAFVTVFFGTSLGERVLERGVNGSTGQLKLVQEHVESVPVLLPHPSAQRYIGDKVRQAERLRGRARRLDTLTFAAFDPLTHSLPSPQRAFRVPSSEVEAYRLNPNHFDPVVRAAIHTAKAVARLHPLSDLVVDGDIAGGATPLGAQYVADGIFFARVQNVKPLRLDRSDAAFISAEQDREIVRSRCRTDDVVLSITGYPGTASVVLDEDLPLNINQHSVRFAVRTEFGAGYVAAAINSRFGQLQVGRLAVGGTRDALDYTSVRSLLIPEFSSESREAINAQVRTANLCVRAAQRLVALAKLLVEHVIDGRMTDAELAVAQKALEAGDRSADREILKGLRQSDAPNAKPLIADVDALYALLDGSEEQDA